MSGSLRNGWLVLTALLLGSVAVANLLALARRMPPAPARGASASGVDVVMQHERRFAPVAAALQAHGVRGQVGYIADLPPEQLPGDSPAMRDYFLTQFALIPWVIEAKFSDCAWAITNWRHGNGLAPAAPAGFETVQDFGGGVLLLRKSAR